MGESESPCTCKRKAATLARRGAARNPGFAPRSLRMQARFAEPKRSVQKQGPPGLRQAVFALEYWWRRLESPTSTNTDTKSLVYLGLPLFFFGFRSRFGGVNRGIVQWKYTDYTTIIVELRCSGKHRHRSLGPLGLRQPLLFPPLAAIPATRRTGHARTRTHPRSPAHAQRRCAG